MPFVLALSPETFLQLAPLVSGVLSMESTLNAVRDFVWGPPLLALLLGTGVFLTVALRGMQFRYLGYAFKQVFARTKSTAKGDISAFDALMTSLAGAIGTGTIVGVATAVSIGGAGALFWMWVTAFLSMATKYAESLLAVHYRDIDANGEMIGGPMEYIEKGLGAKWLAMLFAFFGAFAAIGTGNLVQVNSIADAVYYLGGIDAWYTGIGVAVLTGGVVFGGVKVLGKIAGVLVPVMALLYFIAGLIVLIANYQAIPAALELIFTSAFTGQAAFGGFAGSTMLMAVQMGVARSIFSNEAGLGISSIAAAAARTDSPGRQAMITMTGALISTVIICSVTGLAMLVSGSQGLTLPDGEAMRGVELAIHAFSSPFPIGGIVVSVGLILFAYSTLIAWGYYGEKCAEYLLGTKAVMWYRALYTIVIIPGSAISLHYVWTIADIFNGFMVIPNLIALLALTPVITRETKRFLKQEGLQA
jgi:amino acid carrier protein